MVAADTLNHSSMSQSKPPLAAAAPNLSVVPSPTTMALRCEARIADALWARALEKLAPSERATLRGAVAVPATLTAATMAGSGQPSFSGIIEQLCAAAARKKAECEAKRWKFELRGRTYVLRDVADRVIVWANLFKQVGDVAVQYDPGHAALPWAGVRFLLEAVTSESRVMGALLIAADKAAYIAGRCRIYESLYIGGVHDSGSGHSHSSSPAEGELKTALVALYTVVLRLLATAIELFSKNAVSRAMRALFDPGAVADLVQECTGLEARVDIEASNCERTRGAERHGELLALLQAFSAPVARMDARIAEVLAYTQQLQASVRRKTRQDVMKWASDIPYEQMHHAAREGRAPNTTLWLLAHHRFQAWRSSKSSMIMWLHGIRELSAIVSVHEDRLLIFSAAAGAGKTKLTSMVVDHLTDRLDKGGNDEALAYFYCDRNQTDRQDPSNILRSYVLQLSTSGMGDDIQPCLVELYNRKLKKAGGMEPSELSHDECVELLHTLVDINRQTTLVLDALDEVDKEKRFKLLDLFDVLVSSSSRPVKLFISSRRDIDIKRQYEDGPNVSIQAIDNSQDISTFVKAEISIYERRRRRTLSPAIRQDIVATLQEKSQGMFQWAALQVAQLFRLERERDIRQRLGKLPQGLQKAYDEIYEQIRRQDGSGADVAERAIKWVMCSHRPLSTAELLGAVCQSPDEDDELFEVDIDADFVLGACCNLLVTDAEQGTWKFSHLSVQEYFEDLFSLRRESAWSYGGIHGQAAKVCLLLLSRTRSDRSSEDDALPNYAPAADVTTVDGEGDDGVSIGSTLYGLGPILDYARNCWFIHVRRQSAAAKDARLSTLLLQFLGSLDESGTAYLRWWRAITQQRGLHPDDHEIPLYELMPASQASLAVCRLGLDAALYGGASRPAAAFRCPNFRNLHGSTLLMLAALAGSAGLVVALLEQGADIEARGGAFGSALQAAAYGGSEAVARALLDRGADVNAPDGFFGTALQVACWQGRLSVGRLLLDEGADIGAQAGAYGNALHAAAKSGCEPLVRLLRDRGGVEEVRDVDMSSPPPVRLHLSLAE